MEVLEMKGFPDGRMVTQTRPGPDSLWELIAEMSKLQAAGVKRRHSTHCARKEALTNQDLADRIG